MCTDVNIQECQLYVTEYIYEQTEISLGFQMSHRTKTSNMILLKPKLRNFIHPSAKKLLKVTEILRQSTKHTSRRSLEFVIKMLIKFMV
jgi:hypothetical protein